MIVLKLSGGWLVDENGSCFPVDEVASQIHWHLRDAGIPRHHVICVEQYETFDTLVIFRKDEDAAKFKMFNYDKIDIEIITGEPTQLEMWV